MQWIVGILAGQYFMERLLVESSRTVNAHGRVDAVEGTREGHSVMTLLPSMGWVVCCQKAAHFRSREAPSRTRNLSAATGPMGVGPVARRRAKRLSTAG
jgi:hypothetical protein